MDSIASNQRQGFAPKNKNAASTYFDQRIAIPRDDNDDVSIREQFVYYHLYVPTWKEVNVRVS